jgi:hypothetical protein
MYVTYDNIGSDSQALRVSPMRTGIVCSCRADHRPSEVLRVRSQRKGTGDDQRSVHTRLLTSADRRDASALRKRAQLGDAESRSCTHLPSTASTTRTSRSPRVTACRATVGSSASVEQADHRQPLAGLQPVRHSHPPSALAWGLGSERKRIRCPHLARQRGCLN